MISSREELLRNMNTLRRREDKRPLTKAQTRMVEEQVAIRARLGRFTLFPKDLETMIENEKEGMS